MDNCGSVPSMKRFFLVLAVFSLFAAACSGAAVEDKVPTDEAPLAASSSSAPEQSTSSSAVKPPPEGPAAPDFSLALEPNGEFVLSQEVKPVYMVFWAEW